jgi:hypothetical protein
MCEGPSSEQRRLKKDALSSSSPIGRPSRRRRALFHRRRRRSQLTHQRSFVLSLRPPPYHVQAGQLLITTPLITTPETNLETDR